MIKLFFTFFVIFLLFSVAFTQQISNSPKKIVFVNELAFDNDKTGIVRLTRAYNHMELSDCFPSPCSQEQREKISKTLVEPVLSEISNLLKQVEIQNNVIILRVAELDSKGQILAIDKRFEITEQFINFFNKKPNKSAETLILNIPESKIAVINTNSFFDRAIGIKQIIKINTEKIADSETFCSKTIFCQEIGESIQSYAINKGYTLIFDSRKNLPEEIKHFKKDDLTQEFISEYNKNNP